MTEKIPVLSQKAIDQDKFEGALPMKRAKSSEMIAEMVEADKIRQEIMTICESLKPEVIDPSGGLGVEEIEVSLSVNSKAGVRLIGEASIGAEASIKVRLKRR